MKSSSSLIKSVLPLLTLFGLLLYVVISTERTAQESSLTLSPSSYNAKETGTKALSLYFEKQYSVRQLSSNWLSVTPQDGLLIVTEPIQESRPIQAEELQHALKWVEAGGTLFYLTTGQPRPLDERDPLFGDVESVTGSEKEATLSIGSVNNPLLQDVHNIQYATSLRLKASDEGGYQTLLADAEGGLLLTKTLKKGRLVIGSIASSFSNSRIGKADNAILIDNLALVAVGSSRKPVVFDEFHHGIGFVEGKTKPEGSLLASLPVPMRYVFWHLIFVLLIVCLLANRRFGLLNSAAPNRTRVSTDYVLALSRLHRKARATDLPIGLLYTYFINDLERNLNLIQGTPIPRIADVAAKKFFVNITEFQNMLIACDSVRAGRRLTEAEMIQIAQQITTYRRTFQLDG